MIYKYCSNCNAKYDATLRECNHCEGSKKARYKRYADNRTDKDSQLFYHSVEWCKCRARVKERDKGICLYCLYIKKEINVMDLVHHIVEEKINKELRLDKDNLICLCNECHNEIHREYDKSNDNKFQLQNKLRELIKLSKEELN